MKTVTELHEELKQIAQQLHDEQGLRIDRVSFDWREYTDVRAFIDQVSIDTASRGNL